MKDFPTELRNSTTRNNVKVVKREINATREELLNLRRDAISIVKKLERLLGMDKN